MAHKHFKALLLVACSVLALFVASPAIQRLVASPHAEFFTELAIMGPYHNATYPYNIQSNENFTLYFDVTNHLGSLAYYLIDIKFQNETQAKDSFVGAGSDQSPLGNITFCIANSKTVELPLSISLQYTVDNQNSEKLNLKNITINSSTLNIDRRTIIWNSEKQGFFGNVFFELWLFNDTANTFEYNQRYVSLWLKMNP